MFKAKMVFALLSICLAISLNAQADNKGNYLNQKIKQLEVSNTKFTEVSLFSPLKNKKLENKMQSKPRDENDLPDDEPGNFIHQLVPGAEYLSLNKLDLKKLKKKAPEALVMNIPFGSKGKAKQENVKIKLFKRNIYTDDATITFQDSQTGKAIVKKAKDLDLGVHYHGVVEGEENSIVAISLYNNSVEGRLHSTQLGDLNLGKIRDKNGRLRKSNSPLASSHVIYRTNNIKDKKPEHNCKMEGHKANDYLSHLGIDEWGNNLEEPIDNNKLLNQMSKRPRAAKAGLYDYYFTTYTVISGYLANEIGGSYISNWISSVLNQVAAVYNVDGLLLYSEGWKSYGSSPVYDGQEGAYLLEQFAYYDNNAVKNSDVGMLLTSASSSASASYGLAYEIGGVCSYDIVDGLAYSPMNVSYSYFPTYSWTVDVYAHEAGHTLGSPHTHSCSWNGNNTAIDSCSGFTEGSCPLPGVPAQGQGTVMSYCAGSVGKNPALGFANQPAAKIASHIWYCADR